MLCTWGAERGRPRGAWGLQDPVLKQNSNPNNNSSTFWKVEDNCSAGKDAQHHGWQPCVQASLTPTVWHEGTHMHAHTQGRPTGRQADETQTDKTGRQQSDFLNGPNQYRTHQGWEHPGKLLCSQNQINPGLKRFKLNNNKLCYRLHVLSPWSVLCPLVIFLLINLSLNYGQNLLKPCSHLSDPKDSGLITILY